MEPTTSLTQAIGSIAGSGLLGALLVVVGYLYYRKDKALVEQSAANLALIMQLQRELITAVSKISEIIDFIERRETERERDAPRRTR